jgi:hypothetical protein
MLAAAILLVMLVDVGLVLVRALSFRTILSMPGFLLSLGSALVGFGAATAAILFASSKAPVRDHRFATAAGLAGGVLMVGHMALENFGARIGEDWRPTVGVMLAAFALWFASGWREGRGNLSAVAGAIAGCWAAIVSVTLAILSGFVGLYFDVPSSAYVATWPEFVQSGWSDPTAFALENALDAAASHLLVALLLGTVLGAAGGLIGSRKKAFGS